MIISRPIATASAVCFLALCAHATPISVDPATANTDSTATVTSTLKPLVASPSGAGDLASGFGFLSDFVTAGSRGCTSSGLLRIETQSEACIDKLGNVTGLSDRLVFNQDVLAGGGLTGSVPEPGTLWLLGSGLLLLGMLSRVTR